MEKISPLFRKEESSEVGIGQHPTLNNVSQKAIPKGRPRGFKNKKFVKTAQKTRMSIASLFVLVNPLIEVFGTSRYLLIKSLKMGETPKKLLQIEIWVFLNNWSVKSNVLL